MPPDLNMPPLPRDSEALSFSELVPLRSKKIRIAKSGIIFPGLLTVLLAVYLFSVFSNFSAATAQGFTTAVGCYIVLMLFWMVYAYSDTEKPLWIFLLPLLFTAVNITSFSPVWQFLVFVGRDLLPGRPQPNDTFVMQFVHMFFAAGVVEEFAKAIPILFCAWLAIRAERRRGGKRRSFSDKLAVRTPLDGIMIGLASGAGFVLNETFFEYVPNITAKVAESTNNPFAGLLFGLMLMIPRTLQSFAGHMGWAAIFGYFIGLGMVRRANRWQLFCVGLLSAAVIHGLWNSVGAISPYLSYVVAAFGFIYFLACLLKARQMEPQLTGRQISAGASIVVMPPAVAAANSAVPPHFSEAAGAEAMPTLPASAQTGFVLVVEEQRFALRRGERLDLSSADQLGARAEGIAAEVTSHPSDPAILGLRNLGTFDWSAITAEGRTYDVPPHRNVRLAVGTRVAFGDLGGRIEAAAP